MCSGCSAARLSHGLAVAAVVALCTAACRPQTPSQPAVAVAPAVADVPVGPVPGVAAGEGEPVNPFADDVQARMEGRKFFVAYNCAGCHGDHAGGGMGPSLRDEAWIYGSSPVQVANSIAEGRALGMPAWGRMLTDAQIWQITAYIKTLRTPEESDPPPGN